MTWFIGLLAMAFGLALVISGMYGMQQERSMANRANQEVTEPGCAHAYRWLIIGTGILLLCMGPLLILIV